MNKIKDFGISTSFQPKSSKERVNEKDEENMSRGPSKIQ